MFLVFVIAVCLFVCSFVFVLTVYVFVSCFRTIAVILVSDCSFSFLLLTKQTTRTTTKPKERKKEEKKEEENRKKKEEETSRCMGEIVRRTNPDAGNKYCLHDTVGMKERVVFLPVDFILCNNYSSFFSYTYMLAYYLFFQSHIRLADTVIFQADLT